jgi:hypothetical protein
MASCFDFDIFGNRRASLLHSVGNSFTVISKFNKKGG